MMLRFRANWLRQLTFLAALLAVVGRDSVDAATFGKDVAFLREHTEVVLLSDQRGQSQVVVLPAMQGRVMTSTSNGDDGPSYGWINRQLIASGKLQPHINAFGGEDRFWLGPEGGQFSVFFSQGDPFDLEHWFTPAPIDTEPFEVIGKTRQSVQLRHTFPLTNYSNTKFQLRVDRTVRLLSPQATAERLGNRSLADLSVVAYESLNQITNVGLAPWKKETGLLSIWILGMFNPSPATTVVVPIKSGPESELGPRVKADYFGQVPPDRLVVTDQAVFFRGDGTYRSKLGISPRRCLPVLGSYDADFGLLTLVQFTLPEGTTDYVNSAWERQTNPYAGDVVNSYNDGPPVPGAKPLGPFYELESSSPAAALESGESLHHVHRTIHLRGSKEQLDAMSRGVLGVSLEEIVGKFSQP